MTPDEDQRVAIFRQIYLGGGWPGGDSISGPGSTLARTRNLRAALPGLLRQVGARLLLDAP